MAVFAEQLKPFTRLVAHLGADDLAHLATALEERTFRAGETLLTEGAPSNAIHLVAGGAFNGSLRVSTSWIDIGRFEPGAMLGELSLMSPGPAAATLIASKDSHVLTLSRESLDQLRVRSPRVATAVMRTICSVLADRVRRASDDVKHVHHPGARAELPSDSSRLIAALRRIFGSEA